MCRRMAGVCRMSLKKSIRHPRVILLLILLFIYMDYTLRGVRSFCLAYDVKISLWELLVQMFSNAKVQGCLILFFALLITDLPGTDSCEQYVLVRSGKWAWMAGKIAAVIGLAAIWMVMVAAYTCLIVQQIDLSADWSRAMVTLARTNAYQSYSIRMIFSTKVIGNYTLPNAAVKALLLNYSLVVIGGIWVLLLNFVTNRPTGCFALAATALISMSIGGILNSGAIYKFSPVSLAQLGVIDGGIEKAYPSFRYVITFYITALLLGTALLCAAVNARKDYSRFRV